MFSEVLCGKEDGRGKRFIQYLCSSCRKSCGFCSETQRGPCLWEPLPGRMLDTAESSCACGWIGDPCQLRDFKCVSLSLGHLGQRVSSQKHSVGTVSGVQGRQDQVSSMRPAEKKPSPECQPGWGGTVVLVQAGGQRIRQR